MVTQTSSHENAGGHYSTIVDLNSPHLESPFPDVLSPRREDDPLHYGEVLAYTDRFIKAEKSAVELILREFASSFPKYGAAAGMTIAEVAEGYGWCVSEVLRGARLLAALGIVDITWESPTHGCECDACTAHHSWMSLNVNLNTFADALKITKRTEEARAVAEAQRLVRPVSHRHGFVYLIQCGPRYKIGITSNMNRRMDQLRGQSPYPIEVVHFAHGIDHVAMESRLHRRFSRYRVHGEWFEFGSDEVGRVIEALNDWQQEGQD